MAEKKMAKKGANSPSKKTFTKLEKALLADLAPDKVFVVGTPDDRLELHIKPYLSFDVKEGLMQNIENMYFPDGVYNKHHGDMILEFVLFQLYTGLDFGGDLESFDRFVNGDIFKRNSKFDELYFTEEYWRIKETVWAMVDYILQLGSADYEQRMFYRNFNELFIALKELIGNADTSLSKLVESVQSDAGTTIPDLLAAMKDVNAKDEKKIVSAVLDYQEAKAKRYAEAANVPHI